MKFEEFLFWCMSLGLGAVSLTGFAMLVWNATAAQFAAKFEAADRNDVWERIHIAARAEASGDTCDLLFVVVRDKKIIKGFAVPVAKIHSVEVLALPE